MLLDLFERDLRSRTFGEYSRSITVGQESIRLRPLEDVRDVFNRAGEPLIVCKPLVESQRTAELLDFFPGSTALWAYRNYVDAVNSNVNAFHSQVEACRIVVDNEPNNWRSELVPQASLQLMQEYYRPTMSQYDAAALMWHARNSLYFEQNLSERSTVRLWKYEQFVKHPSRNTQELYSWLRMSAPPERVYGFVSSTSIGLGRSITLTPEVDAACQLLLDQLDRLRESTEKTSR